MRSWTVYPPCRRCPVSAGPRWHWDRRAAGCLCSVDNLWVCRRVAPTSLAGRPPRIAVCGNGHSRHPHLQVWTPASSRARGGGLFWTVAHRWPPTPAPAVHCLLRPVAPPEVAPRSAAEVRTAIAGSVLATEDLEAQGPRPRWVCLHCCGRQGRCVRGSATPCDYPVPLRNGQAPRPHERSVHALPLPPTPPNHMRFR